MTPYYSRGGIDLYRGDCREVSPTLTERGIVIFDAPYSEHVHTKSRAAGRRKDPLTDGNGRLTRSALSRKVDLNFASLSDELRAHLSAESARLGSRWTLSFSDIESCHIWRSSFVASGLDYVRTAAWRKLCATPQFTGDRPAVSLETITIAHPKGRKRWNGGGKHGWWEAPDPEWQDDLDVYDGDLVYVSPIVQENGGNGTSVKADREPRIHETQKPEALMCPLIEDFSDPGELIYDFTAGGATTLVCAYRLKRRAIGIEIREAICEKAARRIDCAIDGRGYYAEERQRKSGQGFFNFTAPATAKATDDE